MMVITPITVIDSMLNSNVAEPSGGEVAWASGTAYVVGDVVIRVATHRKYGCVVDVTDTTAPELDPLHWVDAGPTNKLAMFDNYRNTPTTSTGDITVDIASGSRVGALALINAFGASATVTVLVGGQPVYSTTKMLKSRNTTGWLSYYTGVFRDIRSVALFDLPPYLAATIHVTIVSGGAGASCGALALGQADYIGVTQMNPVNGALNFSSIERDIYGTATLIPRRTVPKTDQTLMLESSQLSRAMDVRERLNAVPAVWCGLDDRDTEDYFAPLLILGIYKEFSFSLDYPKYVKVTLQLEEI